MKKRIVAGLCVAAFSPALAYGQALVNDVKSSKTADVPKVSAPASDISQTALQIVHGEFGLPKMAVKIKEAQVADQEKRFTNKIHFEQALRKGLTCFLNDPSQPESPLYMQFDDAWDELGDKASKKEVLELAKRKVRAALNSPAAKLELISESHRWFHNGEIEATADFKNDWIFYMGSPISDHLNWAVVDRSGKKRAACYGFN